jgi:hypothetical protein
MTVVRIRKLFEAQIVVEMHACIFLRQFGAVAERRLLVGLLNA